MSTYSNATLEEAARLGATELENATALIRRMAERFDGATNGKCKVCGAGRQTDSWFKLTDDLWSKPAPCPNDTCLSNDIRTFILNAER